MGEIDTVIVVAGGAPGPAPAQPLPDGAPVIAADGGLDRAQALGLEVALAVGDFDSATAAGIARAEASGARFERHPKAKDATDLELALDAALALAPGRVVVVGADDGRLDHTLSSLLLLGHERYAGVELDAWLGPARIHVVRGERRLTGEPGELVTLLALHGPAEGVATDGLAYPLVAETLEPGSSRGVSNVFAAAEARVSVARGVVLAVRPGAAGR